MIRARWVLWLVLMSCGPSVTPDGGSPDPSDAAISAEADAGVPDAGADAGPVQCSSLTCAGCCDRRTGQCVAGDAEALCGQGGGFCVDCMSSCYETRYCRMGSCFGIPDTDNCPRDGGP